MRQEWNEESLKLSIPATDLMVYKCDAAIYFERSEEW